MFVGQRFNMLNPNVSMTSTYFMYGLHIYRVHRIATRLSYDPIRLIPHSTGISALRPRLQFLEFTSAWLQYSPVHRPITPWLPIINSTGWGDVGDVRVHGGGWCSAGRCNIDVFGQARDISGVFKGVMLGIDTSSFPWSSSGFY